MKARGAPAVTVRLGPDLLSPEITPFAGAAVVVSRNPEGEAALAEKVKGLLEKALALLPSLSRGLEFDPPGFYFLDGSAIAAPGFSEEAIEAAVICAEYATAEKLAALVRKLAEEIRRACETAAEAVSEAKDRDRFLEVIDAAVNQVRAKDAKKKGPRDDCPF
jgi:hypothetical protein